jgi:hypothetical protein
MTNSTDAEYNRQVASKRFFGSDRRSLGLAHPGPRSIAPGTGHRNLFNLRLFRSLKRYCALLRGTSRRPLSGKQAELLDDAPAPLPTAETPPPVISVDVQPSTVPTQSQPPQLPEKSQSTAAPSEIEIEPQHL